MKTVATELGKEQGVFVEVLVLVRWLKGGTEPTDLFF